MTTRQINHQDIAIFIYTMFKPQMFYHEMIYKVIPHEAYEKYGIDDMTEEDIQLVKDILVAIDSIDGRGYDF